MDWKTKSRVIGAVERMPFSSGVYYLLQRYVTRSIPRSAASIEGVAKDEARHLASYRRFTGRDAPADVFEFGAGWDLCGALVRHSLGVRRQRMVDLHRHASAWQINHVISHVGGGPIASLNDLASMGITYSAPFDARATGYAAGCVDLIASTNTLEHIPREDIEAILAECHRILALGGIMSMGIDYSDHYSHADVTIGPYNFLRFSEAEWAAFNHTNHYQNRLRHCDYVAMFRAAGFNTLLEQSVEPKRTELPPLAAEFEAYERSTLLPTAGYFVLAKA